jgi:hypothetical protein
MESNTDKILAINSVVVDVQRRDEDADLWVTTEVINATDKAQPAELTLVLQHGEAKETIEILEVLEPGSNPMESVVRVCELRQWANHNEYTLMLGLRCNNEVQDVREEKIKLG